jgi:CRP-like cAMP-binding protein
MTGVRLISPFDRILYLKSLPELGELSSEQIARIAGTAEEVQFEAGETIYGPGNVPAFFYVIASGTVELRRTEGPVQTFGAPESIGFVEMFAEGSITSAVAATDMVTLRFSKQDLLEVFEEDFELLQNSIFNLARYQHSLLRQVIGGTQRGDWKQVVEVPEGRPFDLLERLMLIRQGDLFAAIGLEAAVMMATSMKEVKWSSGDVLWEPGDPSGAMFLIVTGEVDGGLEDGQSFLAGPGYPLGNLESLAHVPRWYRPVAKTDVIAFRADHETFFDVMEDDFEVAEAFLKAMSTGILGAQEAVIRADGILVPDRRE